MDFKKFSEFIMIEQTFFALPFALLGVLFAGGGTFKAWFWVIVALAAARTAGMSFNRVIDAEIDAKNPRTRDRLVPKGEVGSSVVWSDFTMPSRGKDHLLTTCRIFPTVQARAGAFKR